MRKSPRDRRLESDHAALARLQAESSIFSFQAQGNPPQQYRMFFRGMGLSRTSNGQVVRLERHRVLVELGAAYPRMSPNLAWQSPIFHPNISVAGVVCLGGYGTNWVPSLSLDRLAEMLWDMIRYKNYDTESPFNRDAASWAKHQQDYGFPIDPRPLRDLAGRADRSPLPRAIPPVKNAPPALPRRTDDAAIVGDAEIVFTDVEIVPKPSPSSSDGIIFLD